MKKLDFIDALRGIAVLLVIMSHSKSFENLPGIVEYIVNSGTRGVQLFYMVSAFTLFLSFDYRIGKESSLVRNFFIRRFFRIAPMYYLAIIYYLFQYGFGSRYWLGDESSISGFNIASNFVFLHGLNPYWITSVVPGGWSVAVEMMFYMLWPYLFYKIKSINQAFNFLIVSSIFSFSFTLLLSNYHLFQTNRLWGEYLFLYFPNQLPIFAVGILMYFIWIKENAISQISGKSLLMFGVLLFIQLSIKVDFLLPHHTFNTIAFLFVAIGLIKYRPILIVNKLFIFIGKLSYSMYLIHFAVLFLLQKLNFLNYVSMVVTNFAIRFLVIVLLTTGISYIFYKLVEVPFQKIGSKWIIRLENKKIKSEESL